MECESVPTYCASYGGACKVRGMLYVLLSQCTRDPVTSLYIVWRSQTLSSAVLRNRGNGLATPD